MRKKQLKSFIRGTLLILAFSFLPIVAHGESLDTFDAVIHPSEHQIDKKQLYYDLQYQPNEAERLTVTLTNRTDQPIKLKASFNRAVTNSLGVVEYSGMNKDESNFGPSITDFVKLSSQEIALAANESKDIYLDVKMPDKEFEGVLAGGLYLEQLSTGKVDGNIRNVFSREIAVLLQNKTDEVKPVLKITKAKSTQANSRNAIAVTVDNEKAVYVKDVTLTYEVKKNGKSIVKDKKEQLTLAPSSRMNYLIQMNNTEFSPGRYSVNMTIRSGDQKWTGNPTFTIDQEKAEDYNKKDVTIKKKAINPWIWIGLAVILLLLAAVIFMYNRNRNLKKKLDGK
ncbi:DUF916 and DUF3324 domain-containing protein [Enterococcus sp. AZ196]|uniref:DUF916 and DUF3324 domain-containing protein n=1 Tax=Enterococcus sp. AZ196 TaxID=2774659 RepID=UPI003D2C57ED